MFPARSVQKHQKWKDLSPYSSSFSGDDEKKGHPFQVTAPLQRWAIAFNWKRLWQTWTDGERVNWHHDVRMRPFVFRMKSDSFYSLSLSLSLALKQHFSEKRSPESGRRLWPQSLSWCQSAAEGRLNSVAFAKIYFPSITGCVSEGKKYTGCRSQNKTQTWLNAS